jgi:hypothetical protein
MLYAIVAADHSLMDQDSNTGPSRIGPERGNDAVLIPGTCTEPMSATPEGLRPLPGRALAVPGFAAVSAQRSLHAGKDAHRRMLCRWMAVLRQWRGLGQRYRSGHLRHIGGYDRVEFVGGFPRVQCG